LPGDAVEAPYKNTFYDENHILTIDVTSHTEVTSIGENAKCKKKRKKGRKKISILADTRERGAREERGRERRIPMLIDTLTYCQSLLAHLVHASCK
jgi:hypothetical protein